MLAALLEAESNLWLIDAFCENLDPITASLIAEKLSILARDRSVTVVITASDYTRFLEALQPDNILLLQGTTQHKIFTFAEFQVWIEKNKQCQNSVQRKVVE
jgi:ABC-type ATPase with predicted acetyltransferase domain